MNGPFRHAAPVSPEAYAALRRRAIFDLCKWDPQVEDVPTLADFPLVIDRRDWEEIVVSAEALARESLAAEAELARRPELHARLGLPRAARKALAAGAAPPAGCARLVRFDFHFTREGWRISEANSDVPGGINEASGLPRLFGPHVADALPAGDPCESYAESLVVDIEARTKRARGPEAREAACGGHFEVHDKPIIALVHATAYTDDRQVMTYLSRALERRGVRAILAAPDHVRWRDGRAELDCDWARGPVDALVRFFPAEWLPSLPAACGWAQWFGGSATPLSNPATALLTQSKRFPLAWDALATPLPTWRALLPETRDPRAAPPGWVLKPALGRIGEGVGIAGVTDAKEHAKIARAARKRPEEWAAQRPFEIEPIDVAGAPVYPCVGVYTVDARVVGAYGRVARRALIDSRAQDAPVLVARDVEAGVPA